MLVVLVVFNVRLLKIRNLIVCILDLNVTVVLELRSLVLAFLGG